MYPVRFSKLKTARGQELSDIAAKRQSHWLSAVFAWAGCLAGCLSVFILVSGMKQAAGLSHIPRPNVGPGFSEATTASIGVMLFSAGLSFLAFVLVALALIHAKNRLRTLAFLIPASAGIGLLVSVRFWAPS
jgi:hypothetical protein